MNNKHVFVGENGLLDYIDPKNICAPIVELPKVLNPYHDMGVRIFAKLLNTLPLTNVKSIPAFTMLAKRNLAGVHTIIENSSGNTVFSLAVIARLFGVQQTKAFVSNEITPGKLKLLRLFGVHPIVNKEPICPDPSDTTSGIYKAIELGKQDGWYNPGQYHNENNPNAHYEITGPQLYDQLDGNIQIFCAGLGTTGTMTGISKFLKEKNKDILSLGVMRKPNNPIPGPRTKSLLSQIAFNWNEYVNETIEIGTKESYVKSLEMIRYGLVVGPSSGFALAGLLAFIEKGKTNKTLDTYRNNAGEINIVFICCDSPFPYIDEYFIYLDQKYFPAIENNELLLHRGEVQTSKIIDIGARYQLGPTEGFRMIFSGSREYIENKIEAGEEIVINKNWVLYDIRTQEEFSHFHIPGSQNITEEDVLGDIKHMKNKKIVIICRYGIKSLDIVDMLRGEGISAYSLLGGITERSAQSLPRWKPMYCRSISKVSLKGNQKI